MSRAKGRSGKSSDAKGTVADAPVGDTPLVVDSDVETDSVDEDGLSSDEEEDLQDDGLSSDVSDSATQDGDKDDSDGALLFESTEETEFLAEDANDRVGPLAKDPARQRRASRRTSGGSESSTGVSVGAGRRPKRQESMNSTSSNDAAWNLGPGVPGAKTPGSILQDPTGTASSSPDLGARTGQETSVRIVSPSTASSSPHPSGYFDVPAPMPPASGSVARRRLFKKTSKDDYGTPGTPGGLLTPGLGGASGTATPGSISGLPPSTLRKRRPVFKRGKGKKGTEYTLDHPAQHDILGIVMLEIEGAVDLPKLRNCGFALRVHG